MAERLRFFCRRTYFTYEKRVLIMVEEEKLVQFRLPITHILRYTSLRISENYF